MRTPKRSGLRLVARLILARRILGRLFDSKLPYELSAYEKASGISMPVSLLSEDRKLTRSIIVTRKKGFESEPPEVDFRWRGDEGGRNIKTNVEELKRLHTQVSNFLQLHAAGVPTRSVARSPIQKSPIGLFADGPDPARITTVCYSKRGYPVAAQFTSLRDIEIFRNDLEQLISWAEAATISSDLVN